MGKVTKGETKPQPPAMTGGSPSHIGRAAHWAALIRRGASSTTVTHNGGQEKGMQAGTLNKTKTRIGSGRMRHRVMTQQTRDGVGKTHNWGKRGKMLNGYSGHKSRRTTKG